MSSLDASLPAASLLAASLLAASLLLPCCFLAASLLLHCCIFVAALLLFFGVGGWHKYRQHEIKMQPVDFMTLFNEMVASGDIETAAAAELRKHTPREIKRELLAHRCARDALRPRTHREKISARSVPLSLSLAHRQRQTGRPHRTS